MPFDRELIIDGLKHRCVWVITTKQGFVLIDVSFDRRTLNSLKKIEREYITQMGIFRKGRRILDFDYLFVSIYLERRYVIITKRFEFFRFLLDNMKNQPLSIEYFGLFGCWISFFNYPMIIIILHKIQFSARRN